MEPYRVLLNKNNFAIIDPLCNMLVLSCGACTYTHTWDKMQLESMRLDYGVLQTAKPAYVADKLVAVKDRRVIHVGKTRAAYVKRFVDLKMRGYMTARELTRLREDLAAVDTVSDLLDTVGNMRDAELNVWIVAPQYTDVLAAIEVLQRKLRTMWRA